MKKTWLLFSGLFCWKYSADKRFLSERRKMIQAIMDRVFVKLPEEKATTDGGIFLCDGFANQRTTGEVVSVGKDVKSVKIGDKVLFHVFDDLPMPEKDVVALRENSILGVFEDE